MGSGSRARCPLQGPQLEIDWRRWEMGSGSSTPRGMARWRPTAMDCHRSCAASDDKSKVLGESADYQGEKVILLLWSLLLLLLFIIILLFYHMRQLRDKPKNRAAQKDQWPLQVTIKSGQQHRRGQSMLGTADAKFKATWRDGIEKKMAKEARRRNSKIFKRKGRKIWTVPLEGGYKKKKF